MGVRVISRDNGVGLSRDLQLIAQVLRDAGVDTQTVGFGGSQLGNRLHEAGLGAPYDALGGHRVTAGADGVVWLPAYAAWWVVEAVT